MLPARVSNPIAAFCSILLWQMSAITIYIVCLVPTRRCELRGSPQRFLGYRFVVLAHDIKLKLICWQCTYSSAIVQFFRVLAGEKAGTAYDLASVEHCMVGIAQPWSDSANSTITACAGEMRKGWSMWGFQLWKLPVPLQEEHEPVRQTLSQIWGCVRQDGPLTDTTPRDISLFPSAAIF